MMVVAPLTHSLTHQGGIVRGRRTTPHQACASLHPSPPSPPLPSLTISAEELGPYLLLSLAPLLSSPLLSRSLQSSSSSSLFHSFNFFFSSSLSHTKFSFVFPPGFFISPTHSFIFFPALFFSTFSQYLFLPFPFLFLLSLSSPVLPVLHFCYHSLINLSPSFSSLHLKELEK